MPAKPRTGESSSVVVSVGTKARGITKAWHRADSPRSPAPPPAGTKHPRHGEKNAAQAGPVSGTRSGPPPVQRPAPREPAVWVKERDSKAQTESSGAKEGTPGRNAPAPRMVRTQSAVVTVTPPRLWSSIVVSPEGTGAEKGAAVVASCSDSRVGGSFPLPQCREPSPPPRRAGFRRGPSSPAAAPWRPRHEDPRSPMRRAQPPRYSSRGQDRRDRRHTSSRGPQVQPRRSSERVNVSEQGADNSDWRRPTREGKLRLGDYIPTVPASDSQSKTVRFMAVENSDRHAPAASQKDAEGKTAGEARSKRKKSKKLKVGKKTREKIAQKEVAEEAADKGNDKAEEEQSEKPPRAKDAKQEPQREKDKTAAQDCGSVRKRPVHTESPAHKEAKKPDGETNVTNQKQETQKQELQKQEVQELEFPKLNVQKETGSVKDRKSSPRGGKSPRVGKSPRGGKSPRQGKSPREGKSPRLSARGEKKASPRMGSERVSPRTKPRRNKKKKTTRRYTDVIDVEQKSVAENEPVKKAETEEAKTNSDAGNNQLNSTSPEETKVSKAFLKLQTTEVSPRETRILVVPKIVIEEVVDTMRDEEESPAAESCVSPASDPALLAVSVSNEEESAHRLSPPSEDPPAPGTAATPETLDSKARLKVAVSEVLDLVLTGFFQELQTEEGDALHPAASQRDPGSGVNIVVTCPEAGADVPDPECVAEIQQEEGVEKELQLPLEGENRRSLSATTSAGHLVSSKPCGGKRAASSAPAGKTSEFSLGAKRDTELRCAKSEEMTSATGGGGAGGGGGVGAGKALQGIELQNNSEGNVTRATAPRKAAEAAAAAPATALLGKTEVVAMATNEKGSGESAEQVGGRKTELTWCPPPQGQ